MYLLRRKSNTTTEQPHTAAPVSRASPCCLPSCSRWVHAIYSHDGLCSKRCKLQTRSDAVNYRRLLHAQCRREGELGNLGQFASNQYPPPPFDWEQGSNTTMNTLKRTFPKDGLRAMKGTGAVRKATTPTSRPNANPHQPHATSHMHTYIMSIPISIALQPPPTQRRAVALYADPAPLLTTRHYKGRRGNMKCKYGTPIGRISINSNTLLLAQLQSPWHEKLTTSPRSVAYHLSYTRERAV